MKWMIQNLDEKGNVLKEYFVPNEYKRVQNFYKNVLEDWIAVYAVLPKVREIRAYTYEYRNNPLSFKIQYRYACFDTFQGMVCSPLI